MTTVVGFDSETTGLKVEAGHRIIEVAFVGYSLETRKKLFAFEKRINPHRAIEPKAQLIHGISQADLIGKPSFKEVEPFITKIFEKSDIAIAHNIDFDIGFLFEEYRLIGKQVPDAQGFDTMSEGRWATSFGKNPNLEELCFACEVPYDRGAAHAALYDVERMMECFFFALDNGGYDIKGLLK